MIAASRSPANRAWKLWQSSTVLARRIALVSILLVAAVLLRTTTTPQPDSPAGLLDAAIARAREAGSYRVALEIHQTISPERSSTAPAPISSDESAEFVVDGYVGGPDQARLSIKPRRMSYGLQAQATGASAQEILIADGNVYERIADRWWKKDDATPVPGVNSDALSLLSAARNVHQLEAVERLPGRFERVGFELRTRDVLRLMLPVDSTPDGSQLTLAEASGFSYGGTGELWIDESGYPARLVLHLDLKRSGQDPYRTLVFSTADYSNFGADFPSDLFDPTISPLTKVSTSPIQGSGMTLEQLTQLALKPIALLVLLGLCWLLMFARFKAKTAITSLVVIVALMSPQAAQAVSPARSPASEENLRPSAPAPGSEVKRMLEEGHAIAERRSSATNSAAATLLPADGDEDQDLLPNGYELSLGTNPFVTDTDMDGLSDYQEVVGFPCGDDPEIDAVETDPLQPDSNGDGLRDGDEFYNGECRKLVYASAGPDQPLLPIPIGDQPYAWSDDNDLDGVPDGLDLSPFTASRDSLGGVGDYQQNETDFNGNIIESTNVFYSHPGATLTFESIDVDPGPDERPYSFYVELQIRTKPELMRAAYRRSVEWPLDTKGAIRNLYGGAAIAWAEEWGVGVADVNSTGMMETVPYLEITVLQQDLPSQDAREQYNVTAVKKQCSNYVCTYLMIVPLVQVERNGQVVALQAKVMHDFDYGSANVARVWRDVRLKWAVQGDIVRANDNGDYRPSPTDNHGLITYDTPYYVTGLQVSRQGGTEMLVAGAYPSATPELFNDGPIALLRAGMEAQFLSGRLTLGQIGWRFDIGSTATITQRWGITETYGIKYGSAYEYEHLDLALTTTMVTTTRELLNELYPNHSYSPTLILASEQRTATINVDELNADNVDFESLSMNFCGKPMVTSRSLKLQTYRWNYGRALTPVSAAPSATSALNDLGDWEPLTLDEMLAKVESEFANAFPEVQEFFEDILDIYDDIEELYNEALNIVKMASTVWHMGQTAIQGLADYDITDVDQLLSDAEMLVEFLDQNGLIPKEYAQVIYTLLDVLQAGGPGPWLENQFNKVVTFIDGVTEKIGSFLDGSPGFSMPDEKTMLSWTSTAINVLNTLAAITGIEALADAAQILTRLVEIYKFVKELIDAVSTVVNTLQSTASGAVETATAYLQTLLDEAKALSSSMSVVGLLMQVGMTWANVFVTLASGSLPPLKFSALIARAIVETIILVVTFVIVTVVPYGYVLMLVIAVFKAMEAFFGVDIDPVSIFLNWFFEVDITQLSEVVEDSTLVGPVHFEPVDPLGGLVEGQRFGLAMTSTVTFKGTSAALDTSSAGVNIGGGPGLFQLDWGAGEIGYQEWYNLKLHYNAYGNILEDWWNNGGGRIKFRVDSHIVSSPNIYGWAHVWEEVSSKDDYIYGPRVDIGGGQYHQEVYKHASADFVPKSPHVNTWLVVWVNFGVRWVDHYCSPYLDITDECYSAENGTGSNPTLNKLYFDILPDSLYHFLFNWEDVVNHDPDGDGLEGYHDPKYDLMRGPDTESCTSYLNWDTDGDLLSDKFEAETPGVHPCADDFDRDGLDDSQELLLGTSPDDPDTDDDGLMDGQEVAYWEPDAVSLTVPWRLPLSSQYAGLPDPAAFPNPRHANADNDYRMDVQERNKLTSPNGFDLIPHEPPELTINPYLIAGGGTGISVQTSPWLNDEGAMLDAQLTVTLPVSLSNLSLGAWLRPQHFAGNNDGTLQAGSGPYVYTWSMPPVWLGRYVEAELEGLPDILAEPMTVTAQLAYTHIGASYVLSGSAPLAINLGGPTVEVDSPQAGALVTGATILEGSASDPQLVSKVYVCAKTTRGCIGSDWQLATWKQGGWLYPWTPPADDVYIIQAYGVDTYGLAGPASTPITVSVDSVAPPAPTFDLRNTAYLSTTVMPETLATVTLTGRMSDTVSGGYVSGVDEAFLLIDGGKAVPRVEMIPAAQPGQSSSAFSYDMSVPVAATYGTQIYDLELGATDRAGNASPVFDTLRIVVDDLPPTVYARVPQVAAGSAVTLSGRVDDAPPPRVRWPDRPYTSSIVLDNSDSVIEAIADTSRALFVGDMNGDTIDDVVLVEPSTDRDPFEAGLFFGQPEGLPATLTMADADVGFQGEAVGTHTFAPSAAGFMDVNGDGVADLLLGDPHANANAGRVYLILGRRDGGWPSTVSLSDADGQFDMLRVVAFGASVAAAGDVDGDGLSDFLVGAAHDGARASVAYLYLGREQGVPALSATLRSPYTSATSPAPPNLAGLGDADGDGLSDMLIAYPRSDRLPGRVALVGGRSQGAWPASAVDLDTFADALFTAQGDLQTVSPVGDVNEDGLRDFLIGDPTAAQQRVFLLFGRRPEEAWPQAPATVDLVAGADASYLESSPGPDVHLGAGLTPMGDLDRDGRSDFAFGNFDASGPIAMPANAAIVRAAEMTLTLDMSPWSGSSIVSGSSAGQRAGEYLSSGDVNGDGVRDLLVGAPGDTRAYLLTGDAGDRDGAGVQEVAVGLYGPVADPSLPYTDTLPAAWEVATLAVPGGVLTPWSAVVAPSGNGDYRVYARAKDALGNTWTEDAWYLGNVWVNTSPVPMTGESGVLNPADLLSKTHLSLTGIVTSPQPIQHLRVYDGYNWYRHLPATGPWSNDSVIPRTDLRTLTFRAVARDAYGHTLHVSRTLTTDTFVQAPVLSSTLDIDLWQTDISPALSVTWPPVPDASGIISTWATIDTSPSKAPTEPAGTNQVKRILDQPGVYYGHVAVRDGAGNSHTAHIGPFPVNRSKTPSVILPDGRLDIANGEYPDGTLLNYDPYAAVEPAALWGTWNADELYLGFAGNPWWEYDQMSVYLDTQPSGITGTLDLFGVSHALPFEADYAFTIGGATDCADQVLGGAVSATCLPRYALHQADGSGWTEVVSPTSFAVTALDTEIVLDRGEIEALGETPVRLLAYAEDETGVWGVLPGGARPTTTDRISGTVTFADHLTWHALDDGMRPNEGQDQVIAPIVEILTSWDTTLFRDMTTPMTVTVTNPDIGPYVNAPLTVTMGVTESQGYIGLTGTPVGATCISCPDEGHQWVLGVDVDAYSTQTVTLLAKTFPVTKTGVFSLPVRAGMANTGLHAGAQSLAAMLPLARARYNLDQAVASLEVTAEEHAKYVQPGPAGLEILVDGDFLGCWQTVEVDYGLGVGFQELCNLGNCWNIPSDQDVAPNSSQTWKLRVVSDNGQVSSVISGTLVADDQAPTAQISPVPVLSGNFGVIRGTAEDSFPTTKAPSRVEVSIDGARFVPVHTASVVVPARGVNSTAAQVNAAWTLPLQITNEDGKQVQVVARAIDSAGNVGPSSDPVTITLDGVGPVITGTQDADLLHGHASDGSGVALVEVSLDGGVHYELAALVGEDWTFDMTAWSGSPPLSFAMLRATDVYDNVSHAVIPMDVALERVYLPLVLRNESAQ